VLVIHHSLQLLPSRDAFSAATRCS
jgi:hypothetical protein